MSGITDLDQLLASMSPSLHDDAFIFYSGADIGDADIRSLQPKCYFIEDEGISLIVSKTTADRHKLNYSGVFSLITLTVHSSLQAVGLTAAVAQALAAAGISANVVAAYYHDHIFVQQEKAADALQALKTLQSDSLARLNR
jgi:hypothetical protein